MPAKMNLEERERCVQLYQDGLDCREVAKITNHSPQSVANWVKELGCEMRTVSEYRRLRPRRKLAALNAEGILSKMCQKCKTEQPVEGFDKYVTGLDGYRNTCKKCRSDARKITYPKFKEGWNARQRALRKENPGLSRDKDRQFRYKISVEEFQDMLDLQGGVCCVCKTTEPGGQHHAWMIDHDHKCCPTSTTCGKCIRGILCAKCNSALGQASDNPDTLRELAKYLENYAEKSNHHPMPGPNSAPPYGLDAPRAE